MMPFIDLQRQYRENRAEIDRQIHEVLDSSAYILGPKVEQIETRLAEFAGVRHAVGVSSGTDALLLALMALGIGPGDEVVTTPFTFIATAEVVALVGARPVFADIEEDTYNIDAADVERKITGRTRALMPVDLFGQCADYARLAEVAARKGLPIIEDAAQSFGAEQDGRRAGSFGAIGCTSFYPAKPLGCYGDGGMVLTDSDELADVVRSLHVHGQGADRYEHVRVGICGRLDALQAAVLLGKLPRFAWEIEQRQRLAARYSEALAGAAVTPVVRPGNTSVWAQYCVRVPDRDGVQARLREAGVATAIFYPKPLHLQEAFAHLGGGRGDCPVSEAVAQDIIALPMHAYMDERTQDGIVAAVRAAVRG